MGAALTDAMNGLIEAGETGLQVAAYHRGELVVDACAGRVSTDGPPVDADTIFWVASAGKVSAATALHVQVERGALDYDQPIATVWPEFAENGKASFTVRDALTHRVGLPDLPADATSEMLGDWSWVTETLARTAPTPDPDRHNEYHARTWGYLVGEIVRRSDPVGRTFEEFVRSEVLSPIGSTDLYHHLPDGVHDRVAVVEGEVLDGAFVVTADDEVNTPKYWGWVDPSGCWTTARAAARLWSLYAMDGAVAGVRLLSAGRVREFLLPRPGDPAAGGLVGPWGFIGQGAMMLSDLVPACTEVLGLPGHVLWHPGAGGALGFADLEAQLAVMICHNRLFDIRHMATHPLAPLIREIYKELGR